VTNERVVLPKAQPVRPDEAWLCPGCRAWWNDPFFDRPFVFCANPVCEAKVERRGDTIVWLWRRYPLEFGQPRESEVPSRPWLQGESAS
jgi:hypothetical protein